MTEVCGAWMRWGVTVGRVRIEAEELIRRGTVAGRVPVRDTGRLS